MMRMAWPTRKMSAGLANMPSMYCDPSTLGATMHHQFGSWLTCSLAIPCREPDSCGKRRGWGKATRRSGDRSGLVWS